MGGEFPSDAQVRAAAGGFADAFAALVEQKYTSLDTGVIERGQWLLGLAPDADAARDLVGACEPALELQPGGFHALAEGLHAAVRLLDADERDSTGFFDGYHAAGSQLAGWHGRAADAFRAQISRIGQFAAQQSDAVVNCAGCLLGAYQVSALARTDLIAVFDAGTTACRAMQATDETQAVQANLYVGAALVTGTLGAISSGTLLGRALGATAQGIATTTTTEAASIAGSTPQELLDSVRRAQGGVIDRMHAAHADIVRRTDALQLKGATRLAYLVPPLPTPTDVHDPQYRYDDFSSPWQTSAAYGDAVRRAAAPKPNAGVNTIRDALG